MAFARGAVCDGGMKGWFLFAPLLALGTPAIAAEFADDFSGDLTRWAVEQMPGGRVAVEDGRLAIEDAAGCTVWFREKLRAPVTIRYRARVSSRSRVSDLNCFWMARDPRNAEAPFADANRRSGKFADYDSLATYYVGYGGNANSTTRFRRYDGKGARPLLPEHDRSGPEFLLEADRDYRIEIHVAADGTTRFVRDGETVFAYRDAEPLTEGWFAFRTVHSRIEIDDFEVSVPMPPEPAKP